MFQSSGEWSGSTRVAGAEPSQIQGRMCGMRWQDSILDLTRTLVAIPSRAGVDPYDGIVTAVASCLCDQVIASDYLRGADGSLLGVTARIAGGSGPTYLLAATLDTAPFGYEANWTTAPTAPDVRDGWLYGRGTADSKVGIAI